MDYDVGITGLSSPPASATKSAYRPAVSVRNNGIHDALASGVLRIYAAGQLIFTSELYSPTIPPGETKDAQAVDYWTPETEGAYTIIADATTPLDQYEPNNHLGPTTVTVTGEPPPPPTPVTPHASQHEEGGLDEVSIDGLKGRAADPQSALAHASSHQAGGTDALNVGGLLGELSAPQTPKSHGNAYHSPTLATSQELANHQTATTAHASALNLANRETTGPLTGRVPQAQIQLGTAAQEDPADDPDAMGLRFDRDMGYVNPAHHAYKHELGGSDPVSLPATVLPANVICIWNSGTPTPAGWITDPAVLPPLTLPHIYIRWLG
ncbi:MAG: hypothetical protein WAW06_05135 [bacterium]